MGEETALGCVHSSVTCYFVDESLFLKGHREETGSPLDPFVKCKGVEGICGLCSVAGSAMMLCDRGNFILAKVPRKLWQLFHNIIF